MGTKDNKELAAGARKLFFTPSDPKSRKIESSVADETRVSKRGRKPAVINGEFEQKLYTIAWSTEQLEKMRYISLTQGVAMKDIHYQLLQAGLEKYEKKHGEIDITRANDKNRSIF